MREPGERLGPVNFADGTWSVSVRTDVGYWRERNEDSFAIEPAIGLCVVADGMGGAPAGDLASRLAIEALRTDLLSRRRHDGAALRTAVEAANTALLAVIEREPRFLGMGTTLSALLVDRGGTAATLAQVGDSRIYLLGEDGLRRLTTDQTLGMQAVLENGVPEEVARGRRDWHILTQALGTEPEVAPVLQSVDLRAARALLLCSDGLSEMVADGEIAQLLAGAGADPGLASARLVGQALAAGGRDNVTVIVAMRTGVID